MRSTFKCLSLVFCLWLATFSLQGQRGRIDSLLVVLKKCATDSACAETMNWIGEQHQYIVGDFDSAMYFFKQAEERANDAFYSKAHALYLQGRLYLEFKNHSELLRTARESAFYYREAGSPKLVDALWLEAMYYGYVGPLNKAIQLMEQAALFADSTKLYEDAAILYSNMGTLSLQQGKRQEAIEYMLQSVEFRNKQGVEPSAELLTYIGSTYMEMEEYDQAIPYFRQAAVELPGSKIRGERADKRVIASAYLAMSRAFIGLNQYDSATVNLEKAQLLNLEINDSTGIANYHGSLGDIYLQQADLDNAIERYQIAKNIIPESALVSERIEKVLKVAKSRLQRAAGKTGADLEAARVNAKAAYDLALETDLLEDKGQAAFILYPLSGI